MAVPFNPLGDLRVIIKEAQRRRMVGYGVSLAGTVVVAVGLFLVLRGPRPPPDEGRPQGIAGEIPRKPSRETLYTQRRVSLHSSPDANAPIVRTLNPDARVEVATRAGSPWVQVFDAGEAAAFAYRSRTTLLPVEPRLPAPPDTTAVCSDSTSSFSQSGPGTCSGRGGVLCWIDHPLPIPEHLARPYCRYILTSEQDQP